MPPIQSKVKQKDALAKVHLKNISAFFRTQKAMVMQALTRRTLSAPARALESPPVSTISQSIGKLEKVYQSSALCPAWALELAPGAVFKTAFCLEVKSAG